MTRTAHLYVRYLENLARDLTVVRLLQKDGEFDEDAAKKIKQSMTMTLVRMGHYLPALEGDLPSVLERPREFLYWLGVVIQAMFPQGLASLFSGQPLTAQQEQRLSEVHTRVETLAADLKAAVQAESAPVRLAHAVDFSWLIVRGETFHFRTSNQRAVIGKLFEAWEASGRQDGCGLTVAGLAEEIEHPGARLRVDQDFRGHPAMGSILRGGTGSGWALHLTSQPQNDHSSTT